MAIAAGARASAAAAHGVSLFGDLKYQQGFPHFDYVNPAAPKGGRIRLPLNGSFDSLNPYTVKGDPAGVVINDTLFKAALDEPATRYGLIAEAISFPADISRVVFTLRPEARFHDGRPITPDDVIFSLEAQKAALSTTAAYYQNVAKGEQTGEHEVTFAFTQNNNRELPHILSELAVLPKHWWTANGADGKPRDLSASSLEIPLGSGPYRIKDVHAGSSVTLERVRNYWAKDLPVNIGQNNLDEIAYIAFQNPVVAFEAFKGDQYDVQRESLSKQWATGYDFAAVKDGRVIKEQIPQKKVNGMQGFVMNLRRSQFQDIRVRQAFNLAFDFEWSNTNLFFGQYTRARSYFNNSELEAKGLPSPEELALLTPLKDKLPPEIFTTEYQNPINPDPSSRRKNLRKASELLTAAGFVASADGDKTVLKSAAGQNFTAEILIDNPAFERVVLPFIEQLKLLGLTITARTIDSAQMKKRTDDFDFDIIVGSFPQSLSPGNEQRSFFGSAEAGKSGSRNYAGIKNEAVDALIEKVIFARSRSELITACRALDRVLMWNAYVVPHWYLPFERVAYWNRFSKPAKAPDYDLGLPTTWWWDEDKAKKVLAG